MKIIVEGKTFLITFDLIKKNCLKAFVRNHKSHQQTRIVWINWNHRVSSRTMMIALFYRELGQFFYIFGFKVKKVIKMLESGKKTSFNKHFTTWRWHGFQSTSWLALENFSRSRKELQFTRKLCDGWRELLNLTLTRLQQSFSSLTFFQVSF